MILAKKERLGSRSEKEINNMCVKEASSSYLFESCAMRLVSEVSSKHQRAGSEALNSTSSVPLLANVNSRAGGTRKCKCPQY